LKEEKLCSQGELALFFLAAQGHTHGVDAILGLLSPKVLSWKNKFEFQIFKPQEDICARRMSLLVFVLWAMGPEQKRAWCPIWFSLFILLPPLPEN
jgi:hypothetical protein